MFLLPKLTVRQEQAGPSEAPDTAGAEKQPEQQSSPGQKEEDFSGEPPLTLFAGRVFTVKCGVLVWFNQMKTYAEFSKGEVPLSQLLCRLHCPHFVPGKTIVRPMTEEKQAHHKIFSRPQTSQPSPRGRTAVAGGGGGGEKKKGKKKKANKDKVKGRNKGNHKRRMDVLETTRVEQIGRQ
ncbi:protein S-acyltransferase [Balamuthia mandrillaris]